MKILSAIFIFFFSTWVAATPLNKMVVFGDSLSDNGNLYEYMKHQLPLSPPYFEGRFTNGPVWAEVLMKLYYPEDSQAHLLDYAFGGAGVLEDDADDDGLFTLRREMDSYFLANQDKADANALYVVWIGSNNYLGVPDEADKSVSEVTRGIQRGLLRLVLKGAKHIMVVNLPDLGKTPAAQDFDAVDALTYLSSTHNRILKQNVMDLGMEYPQVQWFYFDVNQIFEDMLADPARFDLSNVTGTCYEEMVSHPSHQSILKMVSTVRPKATKNACDGYLFFDPVHPSAPAHQLMAERTKMLFDEAGVEFH